MTTNSLNRLCILSIVVCFFSWAVTSTLNVFLFLTVLKAVYLLKSVYSSRLCLNAFLVASFSALSSLKLSYILMYRITSWKQQVALCSVTSFLPLVHIYWVPTFERCSTRAGDRDKYLNHYPQWAYNLERVKWENKVHYLSDTSSYDLRFKKKKYNFLAKEFYFWGILWGTTMLP